MSETNIVIKRIVTDTILRSRLLESTADLDALLGETVGKISRAFHFQDQMLTEKEVATRWPFLSLVRLRNMRCKDNGPKYIKLGATRNSRVFYKIADVEAWIVDHYQLRPLVNQHGPMFGKADLEH